MSVIGARTLVAAIFIGALLLPMHAQGYVYHTWLAQVPPADNAGHNSQGSGLNGELVQAPDGMWWRKSIAPRGHGACLPYCGACRPY
jgi:hypothetical protein